MTKHYNFYYVHLLSRSCSKTRSVCDTFVDFCKYRFVMQPLQYPPLCSNTTKKHKNQTKPCFVQLQRWAHRSQGKEACGACCINQCTTLDRMPLQIKTPQGIQTQSKPRTKYLCNLWGYKAQHIFYLVCRTWRTNAIFLKGTHIQKMFLQNIVCACNVETDKCALHLFLRAEHKCTEQPKLKAIF